LTGDQRYGEGGERERRAGRRLQAPSA
jgi:hypothetical protein